VPRAGPARGTNVAGREQARADAIARLAWLCPAAGSLAALARPITVQTWEHVRHDPGAVLLVVRHQPHPSGSALLSLPALLEEPAILEGALRRLDEEGHGFVDWASPLARPVYQACLAYAGQSRALAARTGLCDPEAAWAGGLCAGLGWLALCAVDGPAVDACRADPGLAADPSGTQRKHWGLDQSAIARRLARRWRLPGWLTAAAGYLTLPVHVVEALGADLTLFRLVRLAVHHTPEPGLFLAPPLAAYVREDREALGLTTDVLAADDRRAPLASQPGTCPAADEPIVVERWEDPRQVALLRDLLAAAAQTRRLRGQSLHAPLEAEADELHRCLAEMVQQEQLRAQRARLEALAEFAAGAGHEINNPLAVISGQAQYLLGHAADWFDPEIAEEATRSLHAVVAQTRRIHGILRDLMLFARPGPPCPGWFDLPTLVGEVAAALAELARERRVRLELAALPQRVAVCADAGQVRVALTCLVRNAVEAAPAEGWARVALAEPPGEQVVAIAVEDSGPGPDPAQVESLFDPFYSGRTAGRGRGLGLPIAWRLARQQGGDVRLEPARAGGPTRFLLSLPRPLGQESGADAPAARPDSDAA
jgi:signal transduction histidine kinase